MYSSLNLVICPPISSPRLRTGGAVLQTRHLRPYLAPDSSSSLLLSETSYREKTKRPKDSSRVLRPHRLAPIRGNQRPPTLAPGSNRRQARTERGRFRPGRSTRCGEMTGRLPRLLVRRLAPRLVVARARCLRRLLRRYEACLICGGPKRRLAACDDRRARTDLSAVSDGLSTLARVVPIRRQ